MDQNNVHVVRFLRIALILIIWYGIGITAFSFAIQKTLDGIIRLAIVGIFTYILVDGRLFLRLKGRNIHSSFFIPMYLLILAAIYLVIREVQLTDLYVLDQLHIPGLIEYI